MCMSAARRASAAGGAAASSAVMARSSRAASERSGMRTPEARAQIFEGAELELLDGSFGSPKRSSDFARAALLDETVEDDAALIRRKAVHQLEEHGALFHFSEGGFVLDVRARIELFF